MGFFIFLTKLMEDKEVDSILKQYRDQIDTIDDELVYLLSRRFNAVCSVWEIKKQFNINAIQPNRWLEVLNKVKENSIEYWLNKDFTNQVWELIHTEAIRLENEIKSKKL